jgi:hypothetical protein
VPSHAVMGCSHGARQGKREGDRWAQQLHSVLFFSNDFKIHLNLNWSKMVFCARKFSNKIWVCRYCNEQKMSSLEVFKIWNRI